MKTLIISLTFLMMFCADLRAVDCSNKFPIGEFGIQQSDPIVASGKLFGEGFTPVYMEKRKVEQTPEVCRYVYARDVFRLTLDEDNDFLYAGCYGDLKGDGARDYVLLLASGANRKKTQLMAFIPRANGYRAIPLGKGGEIGNGFIPQCIRRPSSGVFEGLEGQRFNVVGDLVRYGWYTYFWEKNDLREILTSD
jgi:hypothetical protein